MPKQLGEARGEKRTRRKKRKKNVKTSGSVGRARKLLTLSEVSTRTNISMPTLQRYKKLYQDRIPSVGEGRKQRYPLSALPVFKELKKENLKRRGRPRAEAGGANGNLITLSEVGRRTGISYPTLLRYVKLHLDRIPHEGEGRSRRYPASAVRIFQEIRAGSKRGRKAAGTGSTRAAVGVDRQLREKIRELEKAQRQITRQLEMVIETLKRPLQVTIRPR